MALWATTTMTGKPPIMNPNIIIDEYLEKPYWVIDVLPKQVPANSRGQFFTIEQHFLSDKQAECRFRQFCNILTKLNCYEDIAVCDTSEGWALNPHPAELERWLLERKSLFVFIEASDAMITINGDDIYMTVYNPDEPLLTMLGVLATSEGLFLWKPT